LTTATACRKPRPLHQSQEIHAMRISARNQLRCTVTKISRGASIANVELDVGGQRVVASITVEAVDELEIVEGAEVTAVVKASDVMIATEPA